MVSVFAFNRHAQPAPSECKSVYAAGLFGLPEAVFCLHMIVGGGNENWVTDLLVGFPCSHCES